MKTNSRRFVDTGLYRIVRCPNRPGETIFRTGVVITGIGGLTGIGHHMPSGWSEIDLRVKELMG